MMRNFLKAFLVFAVFATIAQFVHQNKTETSNDAPKTLNKISEKKPTVHPKIVVDSSQIKKKDSTLKHKKVIKPVFKKELAQLAFTHKFVTSAKNTRVIFPRQFYYFKDSIFNFLNNNQEKEIIITADYLKDEIIEGNNNFGIERATYLKNRLVNHGVNPQKIIVQSNLTNYNYDNEGYYAEGVTIEHQNISPEGLNTIQNQMTNKTLHSHFGSERFKPDRTLYAYLLEVKSYLKKNPTKKITITGHTDNVGEEKTNEWIGLQRAKNVANYFIQQGIDSTKVTAVSKGESAPIKDNTTQQGRVQNRRIEIIIN